MKILALAGSPRKGGNTDLLADALLSGARSAGAEVEKVYLNDLNIRGCQACYGCRKTGKCKLFIRDLQDQRLAPNTFSYEQNSRVLLNGFWTNKSGPMRRTVARPATTYFNIVIRCVLDSPPASNWTK